MDPRGRRVLLGGVLAGVLLGVTCSGAAGWLHRRLVAGDVRRDSFTTAVLVPVKSLPAGTTLTHAELAQREIPDHFVLSGAVKPPALAAVIGRTLVAPIEAGDQLQWLHLAPRDAGSAVDLR